MNDLVIKGIGTMVSGDLDAPLVEADTIVVRDGLIAAVGAEADCDTDGISQVIDAGGATVIPGLHDNHVHPVIGDFTPRQRTFDFIDSCMHGGVSTMQSAGEPHVPGRPTDPAGVKALAILAHKSFNNLRPSGVKVHAGAILLEEGLTEADFDDLAAAGCRLVGEIGISGLKDPVQAAQMTRWAQARDMRVMVHTGGASIPGSGVIDADFVGEVKPDVAGHVNGGPTALPIGDVIRILDETTAHIELVHNGNIVSLGEVARLAQERGELDRVVIGTDCPAGSGVQPLGILRVMSYVASFGAVAPELAVAMATGNTGKLHNLNRGIIRVGAEADLAVVDAPMGSQASDALGALAIGDTMAVAGLVIDGEVKFSKSRNTPPATRTISFSL